MHFLRVFQSRFLIKCGKLDGGHAGVAREARPRPYRNSQRIVPLLPYSESQSALEGFVSATSTIRSRLEAF